MLPEYLAGGTCCARRRGPNQIATVWVNDQQVGSSEGDIRSSARDSACATAGIATRVDGAVEDAKKQTRSRSQATAKKGRTGLVYTERRALADGWMEPVRAREHDKIRQQLGPTG